MSVDVASLTRAWCRSIVIIVNRIYSWSFFNGAVVEVHVFIRCQLCPLRKEREGVQDGEKLGKSFIHSSHCSGLYLSDYLSLSPVPLNWFLSLPFLGTPWQVTWRQGLTTDNAPEGNLTRWILRRCLRSTYHGLISSLPTKAVWVPVAPVLAGAICFPKVTVRLLDWKSCKTVNSFKTSLGMH